VLTPTPSRGLSEYGYCECRPEFAPGDEHRGKVIEEHTQLYPEFPEIAGAIYFDYNDYRTQMGDKGQRAFLQRVHGVVDLFGIRKASFEDLRKQSSPIESLVLSLTGGRLIAQIKTRSDLAGYTLRGYSVRWLFYGYDDLPMDGNFQVLDPLPPGATITVHGRTASIPELTRIRVDIMRPTGFSVQAAKWTSSGQSWSPNSQRLRIATMTISL
jgi:beta-glucuronidase